MNEIKINLRKIFLMSGLLLAGSVTFQCNSYDIQGYLNSGNSASSGLVFRQLRVFVSSLNTMGDMSFQADPAISTTCGGLSGIPKANCVCNTLAINAGLNSSTGFNAWLSDTTTDAACNIVGWGSQLMTNCGGYTSTSASYVDMNGYFLFNSWTDITSAMLPPSVINTTETHGIAPADVWTGTFDGGTASGNNCASWTVGMATAWGDTGSTVSISDWTKNINFPTGQACGTALPIYCFERP